MMIPLHLIPRPHRDQFMSELDCVVAGLRPAMLNDYSFLHTEQQSECADCLQRTPVKLLVIDEDFVVFFNVNLIQDVAMMHRLFFDLKSLQVVAEPSCIQDYLQTILSLSSASSSADGADLSSNVIKLKVDDGHRHYIPTIIGCLLGYPLVYVAQEKMAPTSIDFRVIRVVYHGRKTSSGYPKDKSEWKFTIPAVIEDVDGLLAGFRAQVDKWCRDSNGDEVVASLEIGDVANTNILL